MKEEKGFASTMDRPNRSLTYTTLLLTGIVTGLLLFLAYDRSSGESGTGLLLLHSVVVIWLCSIILVCGAMVPARIVVTPDEIRLDAAARSKIIRRADIVAVRRSFPGEMKGRWRTFGSYGAFGHLGLYRCRAYPRLYVYARREPKDWMLVQTRERNYAIAPDDGEAFLKYIYREERLKRPELVSDCV